MHKKQNMMLALCIAAILLAASLSFNIKQLFEVKYQQLPTSNNQTTETPVNTALAIATKPVDTIPVSTADLQCLAESIYYESASQSLVGKYAVGHVVLNRVAKSNYPNTVCGVINQKIGNTCMFSWKCSALKTIPTSSAAWKESQQIALKLLSRKRKDLIDFTGGATHFHATSINPKWKLKKLTKIDDHLFYK
jgi:spore germination cell wall hydrolase CwlJ-like protein